MKSYRDLPYNFLPYRTNGDPSCLSSCLCFQTLSRNEKGLIGQYVNLKKYTFIINVNFFPNLCYSHNISVILTLCVSFRRYLNETTYIRNQR